MGNKCMPCIGKNNYDHDKIQTKLEKLEEQLEPEETDYSNLQHGNNYGLITGPNMRKNESVKSSRASGFHKDSEIRSNASEY